MKIANITATAYSVPVDIPFSSRKFHLPFVLATIETDDGRTGTGLCGGNEFTPAIAHFINHRVGPALAGEDPRDTNRLWQFLWIKYNRRGFTGVWSSAVSAIDIALWDLKGKALGQPIATLLGGARKEAPTYITFGVAEYSREQLVEAATLLAAQGHKRLKMVVGGSKHMAQGEGDTNDGKVTPASLAEDAARVCAVRDAIGPGVALMVDANTALSAAEALHLCRLIRDCELSFFEEPVYANDWRALREVRRQAGIPIAAGQNLGHLWAHRELIVNEAVDISQPNVCHGGGYTEGLRVAALARAFNLPVANGGAWPHHNMHLHAGVDNGSLVEFHWLAWRAGDVVFDHPPTTTGGLVTIGSAPGLGFDPRPANELVEFRVDV
jgi:L-alanine-DL-glutamate epimerase-like enolase superfamily enzyme